MPSDGQREMPNQVLITEIPKDIRKALTTINKFLSKNKLKITFKINIDYSLDSYGLYDPNKRFEFNVNPDQFHHYPKSESLNAAAFTYDRTLRGVCIHEFCHLLDEQIGLEKMYRDEFKEKLILNNYCKELWCEELAEVLMLFINNPFLLKHIDEDRFEFFQSLFSSPTPCTENSFKTKFRAWPKDIKRVCKERWGIWVYKNQVMKN